MPTENVRARLWNDQDTYDVQVSLQVRELYGQSGIEDRAVGTIALVGGVGVKNGSYNLEYNFDGKQEKTSVRVVDGHLLSAA